MSRRSERDSPGASLEAAFNAEGPDLLAFFTRRLRAHEDAADLLAETMLVAWRRVADLPEDPQRARRWLFTVAGFVLSGHRRSSRRRTALAARLRDQLGKVAQMEDTQETVVVRDALSRLSANDRLLITLVHWDGFSIADAAEICDLNPSTARSRYAAAKNRLRAELQPLPSRG